MSKHRTGREFRRPAQPRGDVVRTEGGQLRSRATTEAKRKFLEALAATGSVAAGAAAADRSKWTVYEWAQRDPAFATRWDAALARALGAIETEAYRRAVEGREENVISGGKVVTTVRRYSDHLLGLLLRMHANGHSRAPKPPVLEEEDAPTVEFTLNLDEERGEGLPPGIAEGAGSTIEGKAEDG